MTENLETLESLRNQLRRKLFEIGDFQPGSIYPSYRKCGRRNCACAKPGHVGHGPQYLWNTTIKGKSYAKSVRLGAELQKYMQETARYREFLKLCEQLVQLNERISDLRPVVEIEDRNEREALKKKLQEILKKKLKKR